MSSSKQVLGILVAIPVGCAASLVTLGFRHLIELINQLLFHSDRDITVAITAWPWFFWPLLVGAGGVISGFFLRYAISLERQQSSKTDYLEVINARLEAVPTKASLFRALSSVASIGSGASVGKEGAMVQLSALCGSLMGRFCFKASTFSNSEIVAMAAAAGLASVYHAPLASAIFVAEIAFGITALQRLIPLIIAAATAVMTMWSFGYRNAIYPLAEVQFQLTPTTLLLTVAIGLLAGLLGWVMSTLIGRSRQLFSRVKSLPLRLGIGGLLVGALMTVSTDILGNGYEVIVNIMAGRYLLPALALLLILKIAATALSVGSNAVGGLFTPSLLVGALLGVIFGTLAMQAGRPIGNALLFAVVGMAALLAAVSQAPLMAMLMVLEMTLNSSLLFPVMIASVLAALFAWRLQIVSTYPVVTQHFKRADAKLDFDNGVIEQFIVPGAALLPHKSVSRALAVSSLKKERYVYVINDLGHFLGAVSIHNIARKILDRELTPDSPVILVMDSQFPCVFRDQTVREGWEAFAQVTCERLPVLNNPQDRKYLGVLSKTSLIRKAKDFI